MITTYAKASYNIDQLLIELRASFPQANLMSGDGISSMLFVRVELADGSPQSSWDTVQSIVTNHNASVLTDDQKVQNAQNAAINQARDYLRKQLLNASPNITTIYNNVKSYVDANSYLSQMVSNQITIMSNSFTWVLNLITPTAIDRQRYLLAVEIVVGLLA